MAVSVNFSQTKTEKEDLEKIKIVIDNLYDSITRDESREPDWEKFESVFFKDAKLVSTSEANPGKWTPTEFAQMYKDAITKNKKTYFEEKELWGKTELFGNIAHRLSTYEAKPYKRGVNSIQLIKENENWKIISIIWYDEKEPIIIPEKYLSN